MKGNANMKTFKDIIDANGGTAPEFVVDLADFTGNEKDRGSTISASCWTDDPDVLGMSATFSVDASWQRDGGIGRYDNLHGELDGAMMALANQIEARFGGEWSYSAPDCSFVQI